MNAPAKHNACPLYHNAHQKDRVLPDIRHKHWANFPRLTSLLRGGVYSQAIRKSDDEEEYARAAPSREPEMLKTGRVHRAEMTSELRA